MPVHKAVPTLSSVCVQRIGQLFIEITKCLKQCSASKKNGILTKLKLGNVKDADHNKSEENRDKKDVQSQNETQEMEETNSPKLEAVESNGDTTPAVEQLGGVPLAPPMEKDEALEEDETPEKEDERRKKREGELEMKTYFNYYPQTTWRRYSVIMRWLTLLFIWKIQFMCILTIIDFFNEAKNSISS